MNLCLSLLQNELNPADNETDEYFAIDFTVNPSVLDN